MLISCSNSKITRITNKQKNKEKKMTKNQNIFKSTKVYHLKISSDKCFTIRSKRLNYSHYYWHLRTELIDEEKFTITHR